MQLTQRWCEVTRGTALRVIVHVGSNCLVDARELAAQATDMPRHELATKLRKARRDADQKPAVSVKKVKIELASATVTISGSNLTLDAAIDAVLEAHKEMKRGREQGLTAKTIQKISSDRAKVAG